MNMHSGLFAREKVKSKAAIAENSGAHGTSITRKGSIWHITMRLSDAGLRRRQTKALYPNHRPYSSAHRRRAPRSLEPIVRHSVATNGQNTRRQKPSAQRACPAAENTDGPRPHSLGPPV